MGMAASQARLLSITARLTNNENTGQAVSYSKQRLADQTQQITNEYNEALDATKLTVLTGFNGAQANYEDISYGLMTGMQMASTTRQYVVTDTKGKVLVTNQIAEAYEKSHGNYNVFLEALGYSQADISVQKTYTDNVNFTDRTKEQEKAEQQIHEAWDKYFASVGINKFMPEHDLGISWNETYSLDENGKQVYNIGDGYAGFKRCETNDDGTIKYYPKKDANGNDVHEKILGYDSGTNIIGYVKKQATNPDGTLMFEQLKMNIDGTEQLVYEAKTRPDGSVLEKPTGSNKDNYPCYTQELNEDGTRKYDSEGRPVYKTHYTKNIPEFTDVPVYDINKPVMIDDTTQPIYSDYTDTSKPIYDTTSPLVYDLNNPVYELDKDDNYIWDPINYEGTTEESRNLFDYAMAITEAYFRVGTGENGVAFKTPYDMENIKSAANPDNASAIKYYQNIFNKIQSSGYFTYTNTPAKVDDNHLYTSEGTGNKGNVKKNPLQDNYTFEAALRDGSLRLEYYSSTDKAFKSTTISEDNCIQEVADERAIARAETKYTQDMADLENKDKKLDLELKKLDTEHNALQTEYDAVKNVVDKNVESSFKIFS